MVACGLWRLRGRELDGWSFRRRSHWLLLIHLQINGFNGYSIICESLSVSSGVTSIFGQSSSGVLDLSGDLRWYSLCKPLQRCWRSIGFVSSSTSSNFCGDSSRVRVCRDSGQNDSKSINGNVDWCSSSWQEVLGSIRSKCCFGFGFYASVH